MHASRESFTPGFEGGTWGLGRIRKVRGKTRLIRRNCDHVLLPDSRHVAKRQRDFADARRTRFRDPPPDRSAS